MRSMSPIPCARTKAYEEYYLGTILADTSAVTGLEMIRRIVGMANVKDITTHRRGGQARPAPRRSASLPVSTSSRTAPKTLRQLLPEHSEGRHQGC